MRVIFKKVVLHNFLSFSHCEMDLDNKDYCSVKGINNCTKDNALSNGSGKSSLWNSICWCLTGETIQGVTTNVKNINIEEKECYVELFFNVDGNDFYIKRIREPKPDLKISLNSQDISGKGINGSTQVLKSYLPDLDKNLLSSVVFLGQGNNNAFTNHTPAGRKELLEKLSKSEFMIDDIKKKVIERKNKLNDDLKDINDKLVSNETVTRITTETLENAQEELKRDYSVEPDFDKDIELLQESIDKNKGEIEVLETSVKSYKTAIAEFDERLSGLFADQSRENQLERNCYEEALNNLNKSISDNTVSLNILKKEISDLESIKDVCPTCGQKIPGVIKRDTTEQREKVRLLEEKSKVLNSNLNSLKEDFKKATEEIANDYAKQTEELRNEKFNASRESDRLVANINRLNNEINENGKKILDYKYQKENYANNKDKLLGTINSTKEKLETLEKQNESFTKDQENLKEHFEVISKIYTLVTRDFRGYLLEDIITFIEKRAKEYSLLVFGSDELKFYLDGNSIEISYCNKDYELLSGGEKQKVDIILQFALRDMMSVYLDFSCNIIILDEIFDFLDATGVNNVLNLVVEKLSDIESIFIISHHADELEIPFDNEITVVKDEEGISNVV